MLALLGFLAIGFLAGWAGPVLARRGGGDAAGWALAVALPLQSAVLGGCAWWMGGASARGRASLGPSALCFVGLFGADALTRWAQSALPPSSSMEGLADALLGPAGPWIGLGAVLLAAPAEELFFRGAVFEALRGRAGSLAAWLGSAALFAVWHGDPVHAVAAAYGGLWLGWLRLRSQGLLAPVLVHMLNNLAWAVGVHGGPTFPAWSAVFALLGVLALELLGRRS